MEMKESLKKVKMTGKNNRTAPITINTRPKLLLFNLDSKFKRMLYPIHKAPNIEKT